MAHRVRIVRMRAAERGGERIRPRLLDVERDRIRQQRLETLRGDLRRLQIEAIGFRRLEIKPKPAS